MKARWRSWKCLARSQKELFWHWTTVWAAGVLQCQKCHVSSVYIRHILTLKLVYACFLYSTSSLPKLYTVSLADTQSSTLFISLCVQGSIFPNSYLVRNRVRTMFPLVSVVPYLKILEKWHAWTGLLSKRRITAHTLQILETNSMSQAGSSPKPVITSNQWLRISQNTPKPCTEDDRLC